MAEKKRPIFVHCPSCNYYMGEINYPLPNRIVCPDCGYIIWDSSKDYGVGNWIEAEKEKEKKKKVSSW